MFIGRDREVHRLEQTLDAALSGRGALRLLSGEPGIGKTRLADEVVARATAKGFFVSWEHTPEEGSGRVSVWVSPSIPIQFRFVGSKTPELNRQWLEVLADSSFGPRGLHLMSEAEATQSATRKA